MDPRITLITLGVSDLEASIRFYRDGLGFPKREGPEGSGFRGFSLAHNVGSPEEVDRTLEQAVDAGATLVKPGQKVSWGGYSGYFADPDGFLWEVAWNPHFTVE